MRLNSTLTAALLAVGALVGCTGTSVSSPAATASPSYSCTPEAGGAPVPCGPLEYERAQDRDRLYAEAEAVYRRYWAEIDRLSLEANPTFTPILEETTAGEFRSDAERIVAPYTHKQRISGQINLVRVERLPGLARAGSSVALHVCTDARSARFTSKSDPTASAGIAAEQRIYLSPIEGALKLIDADNRQVESC